MVISTFSQEQDVAVRGLDEADGCREGVAVDDDAAKEEAEAVELGLK
jgi:hypothetical protein